MRSLRFLLMLRRGGSFFAAVALLQSDLPPLNRSRSFVRVWSKGGPYATSASHRRTDHHQARCLPDGPNVNHTLVKDGWCWWYQKYAAGDTVLEGLKQDAREAKKGLWADPQPVPPWEWGKWKRRS
jgi:endonuclease YncB( thermonuclease family)